MSLFMWIKVHYTFTGSEFSNLTIFNLKCVLKFVGKIQILESLTRFELITNRSVVNSPTHYATFFR